MVLIERAGEIGRGVAYSTPYEYHRLNVPAEQMGALPRDPRHFIRWASRNGHGILVGDFAPRGIFGDYLRALLAEAERAAAPGSTLEVVRGSVVGAEIDERARRATLALDRGEPIAADRVALALGNLAPADPPGADPQLLASGLYEPDPWDAGLAARTAGDERVLLLGTGLTMVDVALTLGRETFEPRFLAISRKGLLPQPHRRGALPPRRFQLQRERVRLDEMVEEVAAEISQAESNGGDWRQVIDSLRPVTNQIWHRFNEADRRRFVAKLSRRWDVHRHRMAPEVAVMLARLRATQRLELAQASIAGMRVRGKRIAVRLDYGERGEAEIRVGARRQLHRPGARPAARRVSRCSNLCSPPAPCAPGRCGSASITTRAECWCASRAWPRGCCARSVRCARAGSGRRPRSPRSGPRPSSSPTRSPATSSAPTPPASSRSPASSRGDRR